MDSASIGSLEWYTSWSNILAVPLAVAAIILTWWLPQRDRQPPGDLGQAPKNPIFEALGATRVQRQTLIGTDHPELDAINVQFTRRDDLSDSRGRTVPTGSSSARTRRNSLVGIQEYYRRATRGRLVILGAPGSGKTVL